LNYNLKTAGEKRLLDNHAIDELRIEAYDGARLFKEMVKIWHDIRIKKREFNA
jgi:hypothetical protein